MKKIIVLSFFTAIFLQCCKKEESTDFRDKFVGSYKCSGKIYGFRGVNPRDTFNVFQTIEKYADSMLILKYGIYQSGDNAIDTVILYQDSFLKIDNSYEFHQYFTLNCIDGLLRNDSIFISYRYGGCLNPGYSYVITGPKIK